MVFCNKLFGINHVLIKICHNPYFNRWFSAIAYLYIGDWASISHNPYFNRWFSAIAYYSDIQRFIKRHNPYFNRWFSAI